MVSQRRRPIPSLTSTRARHRRSLLVHLSCDRAIVEYGDQGSLGAACSAAAGSDEGVGRGRRDRGPVRFEVLEVDQTREERVPHAFREAAAGGEVQVDEGRGEMERGVVYQVLAVLEVEVGDVRCSVEETDQAWAVEETTWLGELEVGE